LQEVLRDAEVVVIGTRALDRDLLQKSIRRDQEVIDLVNLEKAHRLRTAAVYKGICW
jgi:aspartate 1-decarboxylase